MAREGDVLHGIFALHGPRWKYLLLRQTLKVEKSGYKWRPACKEATERPVRWLSTPVVCSDTSK
jgi:hypothetical protein